MKERDLSICEYTRLGIPECSCPDCLKRQFRLFYARREAERQRDGILSPEQIGRQKARREAAEQRAAKERTLSSLT